MSKKWSEDSRQRQSDTVRENKPWKNSTGPKTSDGKRRSSQNANKGKSPLRSIQKMITKVHKERLELLRWLEKEYKIKITL